MSRPDFTGAWTFNHGRSALEIPPPDSTIFVIEHREPRFHLSRTHVVGTTSDTFSIDLTTDGEEVVRVERGLEIHARAYWDGDTLVFDAAFSRQGVPATNSVRYSLTDDGRTFVAEEHFRSEQHRYDNTWVFDRT